MRSLAINYRGILPGSLDNTVRFSCLLLRSGDPWRGPSNWGLGTKDTQAHTHIPLALWYSGSLWINHPYAFDDSRGGGEGGRYVEAAQSDGSLSGGIVESTI